MDKLNSQQQKAIDTIYGPILILAGAGSGKTKVLTHKIASLIESKLVEKENILAVTFTNKAAQEMKSRIYYLLGGKSFNNSYYLPWVGTFHSICVRLLRANAVEIGINPNFTIYDTNDSLDAIKKAIKELNIDSKKFSPKSMLSHISSAKNELISYSKYSQYAQGYIGDIVSKIYPVYQKILIQNSAMDFDDLLFNTVNMLEEFPSILEKYQNIFKFILIDEYQDTNHAQYKIANLLAEKHKNICVVGDDAQSIYSFRGANIQNILNFERDYKNATVIKLEQNYRSTKKILEASNEIIALNRNQKQKKMWTMNNDGESITIYSAKNEKDEALWIGKRMGELINSGIDPNEIVCLYRTNAQSRNIEEGLLQLGINYKVIGGVKFYSRREIKDIIAYLRLIYNRQDYLSFERIINIPKRGLGPKKIENILLLANNKKLSVMDYLLSLSEDDCISLDRGFNSFRILMKELIELSQELNISQLIKRTVEKTGYFDMLNDGTSENESRIENVKELLSVSSKYDGLSPNEGLETFLNEVALVEQDDNDEEEMNNRVTLMTIHASKGLEFNHVFIAGMEEGLFPHSRSYLDPSEMEEERRLAYVAYTRAKLKLYLTHTDSRVYFGNVNSNPISRFVTDIPENLINIENYESNDPLSGWSKVEDNSIAKHIKSENNKLKVGDRVKHPVFGIGIIIDMNDDTLLIQFSGGKKELAMEYVQLERV